MTNQSFQKLKHNSDRNSGLIKRRLSNLYRQSLRDGKGGKAVVGSRRGETGRETRREREKHSF